MELVPLGDRAVVVELGSQIDLETHRRVRALTAALDRTPVPGMVEHTPAFTTVTVFYDPLEARYEQICANLRGILAELEAGVAETPRTVEIPVCYGGEYGPDLAFVAEHNGLSPQEVIEIHTGGEYLVYMIGFAPGFPYLGGLSERIAAPRRQSPRVRIPAGAVGIAGMQTGIYPVETPGGWQLIGCTPIALFRADAAQPSLLQAGDIVRFRAITAEEYESYHEPQREVRS